MYDYEFKTRRADVVIGKTIWTKGDDVKQREQTSKKRRLVVRAGQEHFGNNNYMILKSRISYNMVQNER